MKFFKSLAIVTMVCGLTLSASAASVDFDYLDHPLQAVATKTQTGLIYIQGKAPSDSEKIGAIRYFVGLNEGPLKDDLFLHTIEETIPWKEGPPYPPVRLLLGPGEYSVLISFVDEKLNDLSSLYNTELTVENLNPTVALFSSPSPVVESQSPEIVALSHLITQGASTPMERAIAIHDWVVTNISPQMPPKSGDETSLEVLHSRIGVCRQYSVLFAALARAAGIETKVIAGTGVGSDGESGPHAWNQILIGGRWLSVDNLWDSEMQHLRDSKDPKMIAMIPKVLKKTPEVSASWTHDEVIRTYFDQDATLFNRSHLDSMTNVE